jgi:flagellar motility protein MotE (MotC chaperone)
MSELEQLRKEVAELRERLAQLEDRKQRLEREEWREYSAMRDECLRSLPQPTFVQEVAKYFPPGTILC